MSRVWYTADAHIGHKLVSNLRGFGDDTGAHDDALAHAWDETVGRSDLTWVLGDLTMGNLERALDWFAARPGRKRLVLGNHDAGHPMHRDAPKYLKRYYRVFELATTAARTRIAGVEVLLSHFPYTTDRGFEARFPQWRLPDLGGWLLHGHTHSSERVTSDHEIHVGLDAWHLTPVSQESVQQLMGASIASQR